MPAQTLIDRLLADYASTGRLPAISGGDNDPPTPPTPPTPDPPKKVEFTPEQMEEVRRIAAKEAKEAREKAIAAEQARIKAEAEQAEAERKRKQDEERGEFGKVKDALIAERDGFKTEAERIKGEYEAIAGLFTTQYAAALKDLPEVVKAFAPADDAPLTAKVDWLAKATEQAKKLGTPTTHGNGPNPKPNGSGKVNERDIVSRVATKARL